MITLDVVEYPNWKARVMKVVARILRVPGDHVAMITSLEDIKTVEVFPIAPCPACDATGRLMRVTTYEVIDCPRCNGRG